MASKPIAQLSAPEKEQLAVSYAVFVLSSQGADVTPDSIKAVLAAANLNASDNLIRAFSKILIGKSVTDFFGSVSSGAPSAVIEAPVADKKADKPGKGAPAPPPPPPAEEEEEMDMGGLFD